jgi:uncharacterized cofD-like protein
MKKVTVLGGGTGTFVILSGLKSQPLDIGVIVTMMDSGGSTGKLRDQLGVLPPGDLRQCLVALSDAPMLWRKLFLYRFENGDLAGHNFGNLFLSALEKVSKNYQEVIKTASYVLKTKGEVIPVTFDKVHLCVEYENNKIVKGEGNIDSNNTEKSRIKQAYLEPAAVVNKQAIERIKKSDYIVIGPGDLYTSIIPILLVNDVKEALQKSQAKFVYIMNLMTKSGQTTNYTANEHLNDLVKYLGRQPDFVLVNNGTIPENILQWYLASEEQEVKNDLNVNNFNGKIIESDLIDKKQFDHSKADVFVNQNVRSILRHDTKKTVQALIKNVL